MGEELCRYPGKSVQVGEAARTEALGQNTLSVFEERQGPRS